LGRPYTGAPHAGGLAQHDLGVAQVLQGVDLQHHVERVVAKHGQAFVEIELDHVHPALHAGQHVGIVDLDAVATAPPLALQVGQQSTVAATQVEHARAGWNHAGNGLHCGLLGHATSFAMLSK
jgi:hypothetical protein